MAAASTTGTASHPHDEVVIRAPRRWEGVGWGAIWESRELLYFIAKRELLIRYKQSVIGVGWALLQPLALTFIFALFFGRLAKVPSDGIPYPVFALAGLIPWMYVSQATGQAATSLIADANLLSKVYFPRLVIPVAKVISVTVDMLISLVVLIPFVLAYGLGIRAQLLVAPVFLLLALLTGLALGTLLSALNVKYRDVGVVVPLAIQVWLFATPVVYPGSLITGGWQYVYALNPMVTIIGGVRWTLLGTHAPLPGQVAVSLAVVLVLLVGGLSYFRRTERYFADLI